MVSSLPSVHDHMQLEKPHSVGLLWTSDQERSVST